MTDEKINKIYDAIINNQKLTSRKLAEIGLNPNEVCFLVTNNIIQRDNDGIFSLSSIDDLFSYGKQLLVYDDDKAIKCFEKCLELKINVDGSLFNLFYLSIKKKNYERAFDYFSQNFGNENYIADDKYYLYLLNIVTNLPNEYKIVANDITFDDICTNDEKQNEIRLLSLNKEFTLALEKYDEFIDINQGTTYHDVIVENLLESCLIKQENENNILDNTKNLSISKDEKRKILNKFSSLLLNNNISEALLTAEEYLTEFGKEEYIPIVVNLIELHLMNNQHPYVSTITNLVKRMIDGSYECLTNKYVGYINDEIFRKNRERIIFYLNILNAYKKIAKNIMNDLDFEKPFTVNKNNISEFINAHMDKLQKDGILCLKIPNNDIVDVIDMIDTLDCLITVIDSERVIVRYAPLKNEQLNFGEIYNLGKKAYIEKNYKESIKYFTQILSSTRLSSGTLLYLGLSHLKSGNKYLVINYLVFAVKLDEKFSDFKDFIKQLKNNQVDDYDGSDKKAVKVSIEAFNSNFIYIKGMEDIIQKLNSGLSFDESCKDLDENDKNGMALNLAIDFYIQGIFEYGDYYLKLVEHSTQKSDFVREKILEIKKNRKFYPNRADDNYKPLVKNLRNR